MALVSRPVIAGSSIPTALESGAATLQHVNAFDFLYITGGAALSPWLLRKQRGGWMQRLGHVGEIPRKTFRRLMLHAVSVGEVNALRHLVPLLKEPGGPDEHVELVITAGTDTGLARAKHLFSDQAIVLRYPLDLSRSVNRFLDTVKPDAVGLVELEVWPNFIKLCERRRIPVGVVNGRLSERSFRGYRRIRRVLGRTFSRLAFVAAQDEDYAARFRAMGVAPARVTVTGTMKWDAAHVSQGFVHGAEELASQLAIDRARPLIVAGSTGPGEEAVLHRACPSGVQLLCAPRKPERFDEAARELPGCVRRSRARSSSHAAGTGDRFLLDTIGELRAAYSLADLVVVGRSFFDLFGSDPIEPAALGKPVVIGPSCGDFAQIVDTLKQAGAIRVVGRDQLRAALSELLADPTERERLGLAARNAVIANKGASARNAALLRDLLPANAPI